MASQSQSVTPPKASFRMGLCPTHRGPPIIYTPLPPPSSPPPPPPPSLSCSVLEKGKGYHRSGRNYLRTNSLSGVLLLSLPVLLWLCCSLPVLFWLCCSLLVLLWLCCSLLVLLWLCCSLPVLFWLCPLLMCFC